MRLFLDGVRIVILCGIIPAILILTGSLHHDGWEMTEFYVESGALYLSALALFYAERAARKSEETESQLIRYGLSASENKTEFGAIFREHLVNQLGQYKKHSGKIYLLLSTPAYGYAVVGSDTFSDFALALEELGADCTVELVFFSPDDHFPYWANVLLWSELSAQASQRFAEGFADGITRVFDGFKTHNSDVYVWKLWVTQATTVREFAFFPNVQADGGHGEALEDRIYLVLTDPFSISQEQFRARFQARSIRIASFGGNEFARAPDSYFERIKVCPYTGRRREEAALTPRGHRRQLDTLMADYILGRTHQRSLDPGAFTSEVGVFLRSETVSNAIAGGTTKQQLLLNVIRQVVRYYEHVLTNPSIGQQLSTSQGRKIIDSLRRCEAISEARDSVFVQAQTELFAKLGSLNVELKAVVESLKNDTGTDATPASNVVADDSEMIVSCIYALLTSGLGESKYASSLVSTPADGGAHLDAASSPPQELR